MSLLKRNLRSSAAASTIGSNDDLLMELLIFLPAKSLIRFELVNKQWRSVISSTPFRHIHTVRQSRLRDKPRTSFLLGISHPNSHFSEVYICHPNLKRLVPIFRLPAVVTILQSCNGLLLLTGGRKIYYVFNPTTMQQRDLSVTKPFLGIYLVFDPSKSPHYKVFCFRSKSVLSISLSVYESDTHTWKDRAESDLSVGKFCDGVCWNSNIWFTKSHGVSRRFCLEDEQFHGFSCPPKVRGKQQQMIESNGHMHSVLLSDDNCLIVYAMSDVDFSWYKVLIRFSPDVGKCVRLLGMIRGEMILDSLLLFYVPRKILIYRFRIDTFEVLVDFSKESYFEEGSHLQFEVAHQFSESLTPV